MPVKLAACKVLNRTISQISALEKATQFHSFNRDRTEKFKIYRSIPEFKEYILIDQYKILVEHYVKQESNKWVINYHEVEEAKLVLETVDFEITLKDIYDRVNFENSAEEQ